MRAVFIRHAESLANAGEACNDFARITITNHGRTQALALAESWSEVPTLIIHSSFVRTLQTAAPTIERFPDIEVQEWPVHEFTNLNPSLWNGTLPEDRAPHVAAFWERCDPSFRDGGIAESFASLMDRARNTLSQLASLPAHFHVYIFSHGYFINAIRSLITDPELSDLERMKIFVSSFEASPVRNTQRFELSYSDSRWKITHEVAPAALASNGLD